MKLTPKLVHARLTGCRDYGLHGCFTFLDINSMYIHIYSHRWPRRGSFDILARQTHDSSDNTGDPYITDCHLFLAIFFLLSSISATNPMRFLLLSLSIYIRAMLPSPISNSNTGNRKADRNPTPWELAIRVSIWNAKLYGCSRRNDHVAFRLR